VIVDPATSILAARVAAVVIALIGSGTTVTVAGQLFTQDEVTKSVFVVLTGVSALYAAVRTFRRGRLTPTTEHAIEPRELTAARPSPRVAAILADIRRS
jgi:hypothetical protein